MKEEDKEDEEEEERKKYKVIKDYGVFEVMFLN